MERKFISVLTASLLFIACSALAQSPCAPEPRLIQTEGTAEITARNDSAKISIAVLTDGRNLDQVSSENASRTKAVMAAIRDLHIENLKLETSNYRVTPQKDYQIKPPKIKGYEVYHVIEVILESFGPEHLSGHVSKTVGKALESGANDVNYIQFYIKDKKPLEKEALTQATREAMDRAKTLAEAAGVKLKRIATLSTHPINPPIRPSMLRAADMKVGGEAVAPPIETGESQIRAEVALAYEIE